jgi:sugar phosphate isomerase/epimerase
MMLPIGLQVYTVRHEMEKDFDGTLTKIAEMGYEGVEVGGILPSHAKKLMADLGLKIAGKHALYDELRTDLQKHIDHTLELGVPTLLCAWSMATPEHGWEHITETLEKVAQDVKRQGLKFAYHHHDHELKQHVGSLTVLDYMADNAPSMDFEMDVAWLHLGGVDPSQYLEKYAQRTILVHIKDVKQLAKGYDFAELGQGDVDLAKALTAAGKTATTWLLAEQDESDDPIRSATNNGAWLKHHTR